MAVQTKPLAFSFGSVLRHTAGVLRRNIAGFGALTVIVQGAAFLIRQWVGADPMGTDLVVWYGIIISTVAFTLLGAMVSYGTYRDMIGRRVGTVEIIIRGLTLGPSVFGFVIILAAIFLVGALMFVLPGIVAYVLLCVALPVAVIERPGMITALSRATYLTKGKWWPIVALVLVIVVGYFASTLVVGFIVGLVGGIAGVEWDTNWMVLSSLVAAPFYLFAAVAAAVAYVLLRAHKEGLGDDDLAAEFESARLVLAALIQIVAHFSGVLVGADQFSPDLVESLLGSFIGTFAISWLSAMVAYGTYRDLIGRRASIGDVVTRGILRALPVLVVGIIATIIFYVGLLLLVIPGLIAAVALWVALPVAVIERPGIYGALRRSAYLTKGKRWHLFGLLLIYLIGMMVGFIVVEIFFGATAGAQAWSAPFIMVLVLQGLGSLYAAIMAAVSYFLLRAQKEGIGLDQIAAVFD